MPEWLTKIGHGSYGLQGFFLPFLKDSVGLLVSHDGKGRTGFRYCSNLIQSQLSFASVEATFLQNVIVSGDVTGLQRCLSWES